MGEPVRMSAPRRLPLDRDRLGAAVVPPWTQLAVVDATASTNADLLAAVAVVPDGAVLVAEHQTAGRGRLDRGWITPARSAITLSVLLRPAIPRTAWGWLPLLAGLACRDAVVAVADVAASVKWPNDVLVGADERKVAGILVQARDEVAVVGIGLNVNTTSDELPTASATSLELAHGARVDRTEVMLALLHHLGRRYLRWLTVGGDAVGCGLDVDYRAACSTLGQRVTVDRTDGSVQAGRATGVDRDGRLILDVDGNEVVVAAGDVTHLRPASR